MTNLFSEIFGCAHTHYSFPRTVRPGVRRSAAAMPTGTYVVCLDCSRELPYDWNEMKVLSPSQARKHERRQAEQHTPVPVRLALK